MYAGSPDPDSTGGRAEAAARAAAAAESIGQHIIESDAQSRAARLDERWCPKALSLAMLMLQPVMATAAPPPQPMNGTVQTVAAAIPAGK